MLSLSREKGIFHVHTFRCGHAEDVSDKAYVEKTIELGADSIWFTDHAPFPDDPFGSRMPYSQLNEYIETIKQLRSVYPQITIHIGLEIEYFPSYDEKGYYQQLADNPDIEILLLGQHMAEISQNPIRYSFSQDFETIENKEFKQLGEAIIQGINSGYFSAVAHPDRIFRYCTFWTEEMQLLSQRIINAAVSKKIPLEKNISSTENKYHYWNEFWKLVPDEAEIVWGLDAHKVVEMERRFKKIIN